MPIGNEIAGARAKLSGEGPRKEAMEAGQPLGPLSHLWNPLGEDG